LGPKKIIFQKNTLCHSFHISVIPSILLSFLPDYCHSFRISVIPSILVSFLPKEVAIYASIIIKSGVCLSVCGHSNVPTLTSPPILKLLDSQGHLWLPYDLLEVIKLIGVTFKQRNVVFFKTILCHSFRIIVIPSGLLSFLSNIVIPSKLFRELQILTSSKILAISAARQQKTQQRPASAATGGVEDAAGGAAEDEVRGPQPPFSPIFLRQSIQIKCASERKETLRRMFLMQYAIYRHYKCRKLHESLK
jgi:hypothetical protein